ncbi:type II toxin-antitoxin system HipA family toxin [Myceligenerans crystallogenes]|uniref:Type II toxin-antitoxin system HipA family toxin n=1 Tax=Myceligenerans crystallogenes TaxID=316335 RepID=A0ABN2NET7_9MICO
MQGIADIPTPRIKDLASDRHFVDSLQMANCLTVWLNGGLTGHLSQAENGSLTFRYDDGYRSSLSPTPLSLSLPLTRDTHPHDSIFPWIDNLMPDNGRVRARWAVEFEEVNPTPFALLSHIGLDCAGAVQFFDESNAPGDTRDTGEFTRLTEADIAARLRALRKDDISWTVKNSGDRWSLSGQQGKFALSLNEGEWGIPTGSAPSTHIVKVGISHLDESDAAEFVTMRAASHLGLNVARVELMRFEDQSAVVVERFDRRSAPGTWPPDRVHQEDFCQALGLPRHQKYQADGGPTLPVIAETVGRAVGGRRAESARHALAEAALFNWLVAGTDAHAKNFALIHVGGTSALAPLYDLMSAALVLPPREVFYKGKLAMKIAGEYGLRRISWPQIETAAAELQVDADWLIERGHKMHAAMPEAFAKAVADAGEAIVPATGERFIEAIEERARQTRPV